jgi:putative oxidoreductase
MTRIYSDKIKDGVLLAARILFVPLFLISGWSKLAGYSGTMSFMAQIGLPMPVLAAAVSILVEIPVAFAIVFGVGTRPLAIILAFYTLATALIGHHYWTMTGAAQLDNMLHFYKNISIMGGFLLLSVTGPGRYSIDATFGLKQPSVLSGSKR